METNEDKEQQNENCSDTSGLKGDCCSSGSGAWKSLKTALFVLVILAACAVAAHSVLSNGTGSPCGPNAAGLCPLNKSCSPSGTCTLKAPNANNTGCLIKENPNNPSSGCPGTAVPGVCPKTEVPSACPNSETPSVCPKTAVPGCCPNAGPN